jgi:hypothetical protein
MSLNRKCLEMKHKRQTTLKTSFNLSRIKQTIEGITLGMGHYGTLTAIEAAL